MHYAALQGAITHHREQQQREHKVLQAVVQQGVENGVHPLDCQQVAAGVKEAVFQMHLKVCHCLTGSELGSDSL